MSRASSLPVIFMVWWSTLGLACQMVSAQVPDASRADSTLPQLLQPAELTPRTSRVIGPEVVRRRAVGVDAELLKTLDPGGDNQLVFNLFPDTTFSGRVEGKTFPGARIGFFDSFSLRGSIQGISGSSFQLVYHRGVLAADIRVPGKGEYQIRPTAPGPPGAHEVWEIDNSRFPSCATGGLHQFIPPPADKALGQSTSFLVEDGTSIDVMIVYTTDARIVTGGTTNTVAEALLAVSNANTAYVNSLVNTQLLLVFLDEIAYTESGSAVTDINRLTNPGDGFLDSVHTIRDDVGADNVGLFVSSFDACGIAWLMTNVSPAFQSFSFNVSAIGCAAGNLTYAHEVGHNLGCQHNRESAVGEGAFPYSFGYREPTGFFRTVLGSPNGSPRIMHFSNPLVEVLVPTGIPEGQANSADNAKTINNTAFTVANFRLTQCSTVALDCNLNCIEDADDIVAGTSFDCNANNIPDECDVQIDPFFIGNSGELSPIGLGFPVSHTFTSPIASREDVTLRFAAIADLDTVFLTLHVYLNDVFLGRIFRLTGSRCPTTPDEDQIVVAMADFNSLVNGGDAVIRIETPDSVEFDLCDGTSWVSVSLDYFGAVPDGNGNGVPDSCDLARGDFNLDGVVNVTDLLSLLGAWGVCPGCPEDTNLDGLVNVTDLLTLLANWG